MQLETQDPMNSFGKRLGLGEQVKLVLQGYRKPHCGPRGSQEAHL